MFKKLLLLLPCGLALAMAISFLDARCAAQTQLGTVSLQNNGGPVQCPSGRGFDSKMTCYEANVSCPSTEQITLYYGVENPSGQALGTIVMLSGDGGEQFLGSSEDYVQPYVSAQYQVIEAVWGTATDSQTQSWEYTNTPTSPGTGFAFSILNAACRPATFLNWVRNGNPGYPVGSGIWAGANGAPAGMCVHANSGGAGAVGYALAWYSAGVGGPPQWGQGYIDRAELENGPVFSDIQQGCEITNGVNSQSTYICANGDTEPGCGPTWYQGTSAFDLSLEYDDGDEGWVAAWSQNPKQPLCSQTPSCGASSGTSCAAQNQSWYDMSIVHSATGQQPSFNYPSTAISGWLCEGVGGSSPVNNSASQGQLFFNQFQSTSQTFSLSVNAAQNCPVNEDVEDAIVYYNGEYYGAPGGQGQGGAPQAIIDDMTVGQLSCHALGLNRMGGS
jgi:hypothetical protein